MATHAHLLQEIHEQTRLPVSQLRHVEARQMRDRSQPVLDQTGMSIRWRSVRRSRELQHQEDALPNELASQTSPHHKRQRTFVGKPLDLANIEGRPIISGRDLLLSPQSVVPRGWRRRALCLEIKQLFLTNASHLQLRDVSPRDIHECSHPQIETGARVHRSGLRAGVMRELLNKAPSAHFFLRSVKDSDAHNRSAPRLDATTRYLSPSPRKATIQTACTLGARRSMLGELKRQMADPFALTLPPPDAPLLVTLRHVGEGLLNDRSAPVIDPTVVVQSNERRRGLLAELGSPPSPSLRRPGCISDRSEPVLDPQVHIGTSPRVVVGKMAAQVGARRSVSRAMAALFCSNPEALILRTVPPTDVHDCSKPCIGKGVGLHSRSSLRQKVLHEACAVAARHLTMVHLSRSSLDCEVPLLRHAESEDRSAPVLEKGTSYHVPLTSLQMLRQIRRSSVEQLRHVDAKQCHDSSLFVMDAHVHIRQDFAHQKLLKDLLQSVSSSSSSSSSNSSSMVAHQSCAAHIWQQMPKATPSTIH